MAFSNTMYGEYGEGNILEDLVSETNNDYSSQPNAGDASGGFDILQQSLRAAEILGNEDGELPFDSLGFSYNSSPYPISKPLNNLPPTVPNKSETSGSDNFDPTQFFNLGTKNSSQQPTIQTKTNAIISETQTGYSSEFPQSETVPKQQLSQLQQSTNTNQSNHVSHFNPSTLLVPNQQIQVATPQITPNKTASNTQQSQYGVFKIQIPNSSGTYSNAQAVAVNQDQKLQYVVTGKPISTSAVSNVVIQQGPIVTHNLQSNEMSRRSPAPVVIQANRSQPVETSVPHATLAVPAANQVQPTGVPIYINNVVPAAPVAAAPPQTVLPVNNSTQEEQTNKLAALLQSKASQQSGAGNPAVLKIGNQTINISNIKVARALAANIIQQRMKQNQLTQANQTKVQNAVPSQPQTVSNVRSIQPAVENPHSVQTPVPARYTFSPKPQNQAPQVSNAEPQTIVHKPALAQNVLRPSNSPTPTYVQVALPKISANSPINRIQIASVNIPISNNGKSPTPGQAVHSYQASLPPSCSVGSTMQTVVSAQGVPANKTMLLTASQPANNYNKDRLQKLLIQNQASKAVPAVQPAIAKPTTGDVAKDSKEATSDQKPAVTYLTFQVDPNLTYQQVEQVQQIVSQKLELSKVPSLSREQKQLLSAFRAQLRTMETPVQHYYLRNPQLFFQKVYQQLQLGQPFVLRIKVDKSRQQPSISATSGSAPSNTTEVKVEHPTISLSNNSPRSSSPKPKRAITTVHTLAKILKRPAPEKPVAVKQSPVPAKRPSLIMEQLQRNQDFVSSPDFATPFKNTRDAIRRLLPYHICRSPEIDKKNFTESEPLFDTLSTRLMSRVNTMFAQYHRLALQETTRVECSADVVLLQRTYLQNERAAIMEMKRKIAEDPSAVKDYLTPDEIHKNQSTVSFLEDEERKRSRSGSLESINSQQSNISALSTTEKQNPKTCVEPPKDVLLQEAVLSIL